MGPTLIFAFIFEMPRRNLKIFGQGKQQFMINTVLNDICTYPLLENATKMKQLPLFLTSSINYPTKPRNTISFLQRENITFIEPVMWPPKSGLESGRLCSVGSLLAASVLWSTVWHCGTAEAGIYVDEWRALSQRFIDRCINERRRRLEGVVQPNSGHIEHVLK